jgi:hypothetical protein
MKKSLTLLVLALSGLSTGANAQEHPMPAEWPASNLAHLISDEEYNNISKGILARIMALKGIFPSLLNMTSADHYEFNVTWVLDDATKPPSKLNGRHAVFGKDGYYFNLTFFRGEWKGAAVFRSVEFGDLHVWFDFGHGADASVIAAVTTILREENETFCKRYPWQRPDIELEKTRPKP